MTEYEKFLSDFISTVFIHIYGYLFVTCVFVPLHSCVYMYILVLLPTPLVVPVVRGAPLTCCSLRRPAGGEHGQL